MQKYFSSTENPINFKEEYSLPKETITVLIKQEKSLI